MKLMQLNKTQMPSVNTHRRILAEVVCQEEVERMVGKYNQGGGHGEGNEYLLSAYDVKQGVLAQVEAGRKENEISKAPKALEYVEISQKVITGDALRCRDRM